MLALALFWILLLACHATAAHVRFEIILTWGWGAPDGGNGRFMVLMNNNFPGPQLNLNYGDHVEFTVRNNLHFNTTIHFHGIDQQGTPWSDGVPGVTQDAIKPGNSFVYRWTANDHGIYWYHAHTRDLMQDGLYGSILIKPPKGEKRPFSQISSDTVDITAMKQAESTAQVALVSDWTKFTSEEWLSFEEASNLDIYCVDSILVNGKGSVNCQPQPVLDKAVNPHLAVLLKNANTTVSDKGCAPMSSTFLGEGEFNDTIPTVVPTGLMTPCTPTAGTREVFKVDSSNKWAAIHFVGAMALKIVVVSIDEHPMWIYAVDGQYIKPRMAHTFIMRNGERYSAMIQLDKARGDYAIRIANSLPNHVISGFATMSYSHGLKKNGSIPYIDYGGNNLTSSVIQLDDTKITPFNVPPPSQFVSATHVLTLARLGRNWKWTLNNHTAYEPYLENHQNLLSNPHTAATMGNGLVINTEYGTWVDIVFVVDISPSNPAQPPHAMHKHSNRMYFIGKGNGPFVWPTVEIARQSNPQNFFVENAPYRDTVTTDTTIRVPSWIAMRYYVGNPGPFILHCHMVTHVSGGMAVILMDGFDKWPRIPSEYDYKRISFNTLIS